MKTLDEKKLLVKMAKMLGQPVDPALLKSIENEEKLNEAFFGKPIEPVVEKIKIPTPVIEEDIILPPSPVLIEIAKPKPAETNLIPPKKDQMQSIVDSLSSGKQTNQLNLRDKELDGIRRQVAEIIRKWEPYLGAAAALV